MVRKSNKSQDSRVKRQKHSLEQESQDVDDTHDLISDLPDPLLFHILSFLKMEDVIKTSLLSRRWRHLWNSTTYMDFESNMRSEKHPTFVDKVLDLHEGSKLCKFRVVFNNEHTNPTQVDSWIRFAIGGGVKELELDFMDGLTERPEPLPADHGRYKLPEFLFNYRSLTTLALRFCDLNLPASFCLSSLRTLSLEQLELSKDTIKDLTSNCPLLEDLSLADCNWKSDLNVFIPNSSLKRLEILDFADCGSGTRLEICATNLLSLEFPVCMPRSRYLVKGSSSLVKAIFDCEGNPFKLYNESDIEALAELLDDLHYVKELIIGGWYIQVLSIREIKSFAALSSNVRSMKLRTRFTKWELPGIAYLLKRSICLESLDISIDLSENIKFDFDFKNTYDFDEKEYWTSQELSFSAHMQNLKTVTIYNFLENRSRFPRKAHSAEALLKDHENEIEFVRFLLKSSKVLEKIFISTTEYRHLGPLPENHFDVLFKLARMLLEFPRTSPVAQVIFF